MTRYRLTGTDVETGLFTELIVEAVNERDARCQGVLAKIDNLVAVKLKPLPHEPTIPPPPHPVKKEISWHWPTFLNPIIGLVILGFILWFVLFYLNPQPTPEMTKIAIKRLDNIINLNGIRGFKWGCSQKDILNNEKAEFVSSDDNLLIYQTNITNKTCLLYYIFVNDKLVRSKYVFLYNPWDDREYLKQYEKLLNLITDKYGKADADNSDWDDPSNSIDRSNHCCPIIS